MTLCLSVALKGAAQAALFSVCEHDRQLGRKLPEGQR